MLILKFPWSAAKAENIYLYISIYINIYFFGTISETILSLFPRVEPIKRPERINFTIYHPYWVVGYVEGEGLFFVNIYKRKDTVLGEGVKLVFKITAPCPRQGARI